MKSNPLYIAIDVGGTNIRVGAFESCSHPILETSEAFALSHNFEKDFASVLQSIHRVAVRPITAIGVALPGNFYSQKSKLSSATNLPEWVGKEIQKTLSDFFHCSVYLENDATASALGEALYATHPFDSFLFMVWGTGIGGTLVSKKPTLQVTDLSHEKYFTEFEEKCGGKNLLARYNGTLKSMSEDDRRKVLADFEKEMTQLSKKLSIQTVVLGGGVALNHKDILEPFFKDIQQRSGLSIKITSLGDSHTSGLYGALALVRVKNT